VGKLLLVYCCLRFKCESQGFSGFRHFIFIQKQPLLRLGWRACLCAAAARCEERAWPVMAESETTGDDDALVRDAKALPLAERLTHVNWRVRVDAYADVVKEVGWAEDADTPPLKEFGAHRQSLASNPHARTQQLCANPVQCSR
jgi:hypothetical protein